jgi:transcriptional regulator with XRE-family HTH domain
MLNMTNPDHIPDQDRQYYRLANLVKEIRLEKKLSQREFSRMLGMSNAYVAHLESGKIQPSVKTLRNISTTLGLPYNRLALLAKYIDHSIFNQPVNADDSIRIRAIADLTDEEWQSVLDYVNYVRTKRKN